MALSAELIAQFAKVATVPKKKRTESTAFGSIVEYNSATYVKLDGSELLTPVTSTTTNSPDDRVTVLIKDHTATITGNITDPAPKGSDVDRIGTQISEFEIVVAGKVDTVEFNAEKARIDALQATDVTVQGKLNANEASINALTADNTIINDKLTAHTASIESLTTVNADITGRLTAVDADIDSLQADNATVKNTLTAHGASIDTLVTDNATVKQSLTAAQGTIDTLQTTKLSAADIEGKYANIDFSNIGKAAIEHFYATSGIIKNLVVGDTTVTGELVGVTVTGDLIKGGTVVADKLVVKGTDGLYYKLNTDGVKTEAEQTDYNSLNGSVITAKSITATKIDVNDLVAFDATIGGFAITTSAIYSGAKNSATNTTRGVYLDSTGQLSLGDGTTYLKYYKDTDGTFKLAISADKICMGIGQTNVEDAINDLSSNLNLAKTDISATKQSIENTVSATYVTKVDQSAAVSGINASIGAIQTDIMSIKETSNQLSLTIEQQRQQGATNVTTATGFTFDETGLHVVKSNSDMSTSIDEDGMTVKNKDTAVLVADSTGVNAVNLYASTFLIVGGRSRFENYGSDRTGCFYVG